MLLKNRWIILADNGKHIFKNRNKDKEKQLKVFKFGKMSSKVDLAKRSKLNIWTK
jgi:hypothetical protein